MKKMSKTKNILKIAGIFLILILLNACTDVLDQVPSDKIGIDRILNKKAVEGFRTNSYGHMANSFTEHSSGQLLEAFSDDAFRAGTGISFDFHNGLLSPSQNMFSSAIWEDCWQGIRKCNLAIEYLPQSTVSKDLISDEDLKRWYDEVILLRAWYHFTLIQNFVPIPFIEEAFKPDYTGWAELTRPAYDEIASKIVTECNEVISKGLLPLRWQVSNDYDKVNMAFAYALKSRVLLYNASLLNNPEGERVKWEEAANAAQQCLDAIMPEYQLLPMAEYANLFNESVTVLNREIITFSHQRSRCDEQ